MAPQLASALQILDTRGGLLKFIACYKFECYNFVTFALGESINRIRNKTFYVPLLHSKHSFRIPFTHPFEVAFVSGCI